MGASSAAMGNPTSGALADGRAALEKLLTREESELLRLGDESKRLANELLELRFKHYQAEDHAEALINEIVVLDSQIERSASDRKYLEEHGMLPPPNFHAG